jgi:hypothetical protein
MPSEKDELGIMEDFEWALKDPNEEKLRELGTVVSTVTMKLVAAIADLQTALSDVQTKLGALDSRVSQLDSRIAGARTAGPSAGFEMGASGAAASPGMPKSAAAKAPTPAPAAAAGGGGGLMGELKSLLTARRKKTEP